MTHIDLVAEWLIFPSPGAGDLQLLRQHGVTRERGAELRGGLQRVGFMIHVGPHELENVTARYYSHSRRLFDSLD